MSGRGYQPRGAGPRGQPPRGGSSGKSSLTGMLVRISGPYAVTIAATVTPTLTLTFRDSGVLGAEIATLGEYVIGAVEPWGNSSSWSFYPETARRLYRHPAASAQQAREIIREHTIDMLRAMGLSDVALAVSIEPKSSGRK